MDQINGKIVEDSQDEIDIGELLAYLKTKWIALVAALLVGCILAGAATKLLITPKYTATSKVYIVSASGKNIINLEDLQLGTSLSSDYTELMKTRPICKEVIEDLGLDYTVEELRGMTTIDSINDTRVLRISVVSPDPEEAKEIANSFADKAVTYLPKLMEISPPNIAEKAITPVNPTSPNTKKNTAVGGFLALVLVVGVYVLQFLMDDTVKSAEDVEKLIGVMPLTVILENKETAGESKQKQKKKKGKRRK
ncbi:MAG: Wzz/FepE/Etk N-terminal domain-containing protein [Lachnospiraceae bacterium]